MTKKDLIKAISKDTGLTQENSRAALDSALSNIVNFLSNAEQLQLPNFGNGNSNISRLILPNFGTFKKVIRPPRICNNPRTGEKIEVGEKIVVKFKAGKKLIETLNK